MSGVTVSLVLLVALGIFAGGVTWDYRREQRRWAAVDEWESEP